MIGKFFRLAIALAVFLVSGFELQILAQTVHQSLTAGGGYLPQRVYDAKEKRYTDFESMLLDLSRQDVVFVGEQHDDPATHRLERAILEGMSRRRSKIIVSLEMFERDVQNSLNDYLAGRMSEEDFLKGSRPWPRYVTDYRPLVEFAKAHQWPVIAGNVPRRYASKVAREGMAALSSLPDAEKELLAAEFVCPFDDYFDRFAETMSSHPGSTGQATSGNSASGSAGNGSAGPGEAPPKTRSDQEKAAERRMIERFYLAQCVKDETMAESIASQLQTAQGRLVVHFNGAFHSDYRLGTASRVKRRLTKVRSRVVSIVPVDSLDEIEHKQYHQRGDYVVFTLKPR